jgi:hypothetical protein
MYHQHSRAIPAWLIIRNYLQSDFRFCLSVWWHLVKYSWASISTLFLRQSVIFWGSSLIICLIKIIYYSTRFPLKYWPLSRLNFDNQNVNYNCWCGSVVWRRKVHGKHPWYRKKPMLYRYFRCGIGIFPLRAFPIPERKVFLTV